MIIRRRGCLAPSPIPAAKRRWFAEGDGWKIETFDVDFRVGGYERSRFRFLDGPLVTNDTVYQDIVPDERIIIAYAMTIAEKPISCSLATIEFKPTGKGTRLVYTEQGAFLDKLDQVAGPRARVRRASHCARTGARGHEDGA